MSTDEDQVSVPPELFEVAWFRADRTGAHRRWGTRIDDSGTAFQFTSEETARTWMRQNHMYTAEQLRDAEQVNIFLEHAVEMEKYEKDLRTYHRGMESTSPDLRKIAQALGPPRVPSPPKILDGSWMPETFCEVVPVHKGKYAR